MANSLGRPSTYSAPGPSSDESRTVSYLFLGKIALFPVIILFLAGGAVALFTFRSGFSAPDFNTPTPLGAYWESDDLYYGLAGLILSILCVIVLVFFLFWLVIRVSFIFNPKEGKFSIIKRGIFRTAILEFSMSDLSLHYFRTHFAEDKRWLQFVVREGDYYYKLYSWRGKGTQTETFLKLFHELQTLLEKSQQAMLIPVHPGAKYPSEIVSKEEFTLIGPFTARMKGFVARQRNQQSRDQRNHQNELSHLRSMTVQGAGFAGSFIVPSTTTTSFDSTRLISKEHQKRTNFNKTIFTAIGPSAKMSDRKWAADPLSSETAICEEQIEMIDYDSILRHFRYEKKLGAPVMVGDALHENNLIAAAAMIRKA